LRRRRRPGEHGAVHPEGEPAWAVPRRRRAQRLRDGAAPPVAEVLAGEEPAPASRRRRCAASSVPFRSSWIVNLFIFL
jgi:hypothetical protein